MMIGLIAVFLVSYAVFLLNLGANQSIIANTKSLLTNNYPSVKYSFQMLETLDKINDAILSNDSTQFQVNSFLNKFSENLEMQRKNVTEVGELEFTNSVTDWFDRFKSSVLSHEFLSNQAAYHEKYLTLRSHVVSIYNLNISELERKNVLIEDSALRISNIHQKIGIIGLTILAIFIVLIPLFIINPINKLSNRMITFYKTNFNKDIEIKANHELEKLEEIFEKIVIEAKSGQKETM